MQAGQSQVAEPTGKYQGKMGHTRLGPQYPLAHTRLQTRSESVEWPAGVPPDKPLVPLGSVSAWIVGGPAQARLEQPLTCVQAGFAGVPS